MTRIAVVSAGLREPSSTKLLADQLAAHRERFDAIKGAACIDVGQVRGEDQRRHRQRGLFLEPHLPKNRADEAVGQIVHAPL